jgi:hypothetical protein
VSAIAKTAGMAAAGTTGNNTHASVALNPAAKQRAAVLIIEAVGATPTITAKLQGSLDPLSVADGAANWFDLWATPAGANAEAANQVQTVVGAWPVYIDAIRKFARRVRLVTSANTNVTYRAELQELYN